MLNKWFEFGFYVDQSMRSAMPCGTSSKRDSATKSNQSRVHKYPYRQIVQRRKRRLENINVVNLWDSLPEAVYLTFEVMESGPRGGRAPSPPHRVRAAKRFPPPALSPPLHQLHRNPAPSRLVGPEDGLSSR